MGESEAGGLVMRGKRRIHPAARAERQVREACCDLAAAIDKYHRPVTIDEVCPSSFDGSKSDPSKWKDWTLKRLDAAIASGSVVRVGENYTLTADGWDRIGGPSQGRLHGK